MVCCCGSQARAETLQDQLNAVEVPRALRAGLPSNPHVPSRTQEDFVVLKEEFEEMRAEHITEAQRLRDEARLCLSLAGVLLLCLSVALSFLNVHGRACLCVLPRAAHCT